MCDDQLTPAETLGQCGAALQELACTLAYPLSAKQLALLCCTTGLGHQAGRVCIDLIGPFEGTHPT